MSIRRETKQGPSIPFFNLRSPPIKHLSNQSKIVRSAGLLRFSCPICFIEFNKPAAWAKRVNNNFCSRACAAEGRRIHVILPCTVCSKEMDLSPSLAKKISTCSKRCSSMRRRKGAGAASPQGTAAYLRAAKVMSARGCCEACDREYGPWVVRGISVSEVDGMFVADTSSARLLCRACYHAEHNPVALVSAFAARGLAFRGASA